MNQNFEYIVPTPSDFGNFVYCGVQWALNKNHSLNGLKKAKYGSYDPYYETIVDHNNLLLGQQNEHLCVDWIRSRYGASDQLVLFNGTGMDNPKSINSKIKPLGVAMQCKPDLIIARGDRNLLFEFKAVKKSSYLQHCAFDSVYAQVWCYTMLSEVKLSEYYLLRYFVDPSQSVLTKLTARELGNKKFERLFEEYIVAVKAINKISSDPRKRKDIAGMSLDMFNRPKYEMFLKCPGCVWGKLMSCQPDWLLNRV